MRLLACLIVAPQRATMSQQSSLTQSAHSVRQVLTAYSVEIGANGWRIAEDPPVRFRRSAGMQPLPLPVRGGSIESLAPFLNLAIEHDFVLVVAWLLGALRAGRPYP